MHIILRQQNPAPQTTNAAAVSRVDTRESITTVDGQRPSCRGPSFLRRTSTKYFLEPGQAGEGAFAHSCQSSCPLRCLMRDLLPRACKPLLVLTTCVGIPFFPDQWYASRSTTQRQRGRTGQRRTWLGANFCETSQARSVMHRWAQKYLPPSLRGGKMK